VDELWKLQTRVAGNRKELKEEGRNKLSRIKLNRKGSITREDRGKGPSVGTPFFGRPKGTADDHIEQKEKPAPA